MIPEIEIMLMAGVSLCTFLIVRSALKGGPDE